MPTAATTLLTEEQLTKGLKALCHWHLENGSLVRNYIFPSFPAAMRFVNSVAAVSEEQNHHADMEIHYDCVRLELRSHDVHGLTTRDLKLARAIDQLTIRPAR